jgi:alkylhydroperoxidase/carboxymuconolactone decarboxylase family protein YurZ
VHAGLGRLVLDLGPVGQPVAAGIVPAVTAGEDFDTGLSIRREVLGDEFVDANLAGSDEFMMTFQHLVTELAWGRAWSGTALDRKSKALLTLGILAALGRYEELAIYARGALTCGATVGEIEEVLVHVTIYCGTPAGRQSFLAVHEALLSAGAFPAE